MSRAREKAEPERRDAEAEAALEAALDAAERAGFRLMLIGRSIALAVAVGWALYGTALSGNPTGPLIASGALLAGLFALRELVRGRDRMWRRFALVGFDIALYAGAMAVTPLIASGDVPQHFVFRVQGTEFLWIVVLVSALALTPALTAFAGLASAASVLAVFAAVTADLRDAVSWSDLPAAPTAQAYMALVLDPRFVGFGNRIVEAAALALGGLLLALAVARARRVVAAHSAEAARRRRVETVFGRHVPEAIAARLLGAPDAFAPTIQDAAALHLDAVGFTAFAEGKPPGAVMEALDRMLSRASSEIVRRGGVVVGFSGDSLLAVFGAPVAAADDVERAVEAARAVLAGAGGDALAVRIGVAHGPIAYGVIGSKARQAFTVYGEAVNLAQRLEAANKALGTRLLISEAAAARLSRREDLEPIGPLTLPGLSEPVTAWSAPS